MATDLHEQLADLASGTTSASPPTDLWSRGVRRRRWVAAGRAGVALVLVLLVGLGGWTWHSARPVQPADPHGSRHVPDRFFYDVSPWTRTFDGPPGQLITVFTTVRETIRHTSNGVIGVTASTGSYGFLDLPADAAPMVDMALSPDGRRLAFWVTGTPSGSANTVREDGQSLAGVGVYDTVTGRVREEHLATVHGIEGRALLWTGDSSLLLSYGQIQGADGTENETSSGFGETEVWDLASAARPVVQPVDRLWSWVDSYDTRGTGGVVASLARNGHTWVVADPGDPASRRPFRMTRDSRVLVLSPDHRRVVGVLGQHVEQGPLEVARIPRHRGGFARFRPLRFGSDWFRPLAWVDLDHVAALRKVVVNDDGMGPHVVGQVELLDLRTGSVRPLVAEFGGNGTNSSDQWLALGLLGAPSATAHHPPSPPDLRSWAIGLGMASGFVLICGLALWSSRVRRT